MLEHRVMSRSYRRRSTERALRTSGSRKLTPTACSFRMSDYRAASRVVSSGSGACSAVLSPRVGRNANARECSGSTNLTIRVAAATSLRRGLRRMCRVWRRVRRFVKHGTLLAVMFDAGEVVTANTIADGCLDPGQKPLQSVTGKPHDRGVMTSPIWGVRAVSLRWPWPTQD